MSALAIPNFSNGKWLSEISLSCGVDDKQRKVVSPFKNDGTSIVVKELPPTITEVELKHIVEDCQHVTLKPVAARTVRNEDGTLRDMPPSSLAFMSFPSSTKAYLAVCALHERFFNETYRSVAMIKKSKDVLIAEREADRMAAKEAKRQAEWEAYQLEQKALRKAQRNAQKEAQENTQENTKKEAKPTLYGSKEEAPRIYKKKQVSEYNGWKQDWFCPKCSSLNFFPRSSCLKCKTEFVCPEPEALKKRREDRRKEREENLQKE
jgi:hypothetical protein